MKLRVVTWNVHSCIGTDGRLEPARVAEVLSTLDADLIGLQEVDSRHAHPAARDQLPYFAEQLGLHAISGPNLRDGRGEFGNALLTREPATAHARVDLSVAGVEPRGAIDAHFSSRTSGFRLRVLVTHLGLTGASRALQIAMLRAHIESGVSRDGMLLLGDLNEWRPRAIAGPALVPGLFAVSSRVRTFPSRFPVLPLDRILIEPTPIHLRVRAVRTRAARVASDHLPLVADLEWTGPLAGEA